MPPTAAPPLPPLVAFRPPVVEVGQTVHWRYGPDPSETPIPAMVVKVGLGTLSLALFTPSQKTFTLKSGVRHADDPFLATMPSHDAGCWRQTPRDLAIDALLLGFRSEGE